MKKFLKKLLLFIVPALLYSITAFFAMPWLMSQENGPSTQEQISESFKNAASKEYDLLILGNSRTYRGLNPDVFTPKTYNFSHDNDSFNQIFHKLKYLENKGKKFSSIILGVDYFEFSIKSDSRNYVYGDYFGEDYLNDYDGSSLTRLKVSHYLESINPKKLGNINFGKLGSAEADKNRPFLRENGQYIAPGTAKEDDMLKRDKSRLEFQVNYFNKILEYCKSRNIKVFMVMLPVRENELKQYTPQDIESFNTFIGRNVDNTNVYYMDYSRDKGFTTKDYTDITHLNEAAADRFTKILDADIAKMIKK